MRPLDDSIYFATLRSFELTVAELYLTYAALFFSDCPMWLTLVQEEMRHVTRLAGLPGDTCCDSGCGAARSAAVQALESATAFVQARIREAEQGGTSRVEAMIIALEVENLKFESFFPSFEFQGYGAVLSRSEVAGAVMHRRQEFEEWLDRVHG